MVTVKLHDTGPLPLASLTEYVTVVVPIGNTDPGAGPAVRVVTAPAQLSVPTGGVQVAIAPEGHVGSVTMLLGQVIVGGVESIAKFALWVAVLHAPIVSTV